MQLIKPKYAIGDVVYSKYGTTAKVESIELGYEEYGNELLVSYYYQTTLGLYEESNIVGVQETLF